MRQDIRNSRGLRRGPDAHIGQNEERDRSRRETMMWPLPSCSRAVTGSCLAEPNQTLLVDPSNAALTVTLPTSTGYNGRVVFIKNTTSSVNAITVAPRAGEEVEGTTSLTMNTALDSVCLVADGSGGWWSI